MGFDRRGYYYRSVRDGDRVRRVYLGLGPAAQLAALLVEERRSERRARSLARQAGEAALAPAEARLGELEGLADELMRATLLVAGYHRHDRGAWRRRRMNGSGAKDGMRVSTEVTRIDGTAEGSARDGVPSPVDGKDPGDRPLTEGERRELLGRAEQGDRTVLPALMRLLDASPALWKHCGDVAREAEALWIDLIAGRDLLVRQSLRRKVADMKVELGGPAAPPMERLLVDRVVATWMQLAQADMALARLKGGEASIAQLDLMQRRQERAQRSHLAAMKTLATVRRLGVATAPAATTEAAGFNEERPRRGRKDRVRSGGVPDPGTRHSTDGDRGASDDRPGVAAGKPAKREDLVPKALRDRMKGIVGAEN